MSKHLTRIVVLLLVPCLMADPATVLAVGPVGADLVSARVIPDGRTCLSGRQAQGSPLQFPFTSQALALMVSTIGMDHPTPEIFQAGARVGSHEPADLDIQDKQKVLSIDSDIESVDGTIVVAVPSMAAKDNFLATRGSARRIPLWILSEAVGLSARQILGDSPAQRMQPEQLLHILDGQDRQATERLKRYLDGRPSHWREAHAFVSEYALPLVQEPLITTNGVQKDVLAHRLAVLLKPLVATREALPGSRTWGFRIQNRRDHLKDLFKLVVDAVYDPPLTITTEGGRDALSNEKHVLKRLLSLEQFERDPQEKRILNSAIRRLSRADFTKIDLSRWESILAEAGLNRSRHWNTIQKGINDSVLHVAVCEISARTDQRQDDYLARLENVRPLLQGTETFDYIFDDLDSSVYQEVQTELRQSYVGSLSGFRPTEGMARRAMARAERNISERWFPNILNEISPNQIGVPRRDRNSQPGSSEPRSPFISGTDLLKEGTRLNSLSAGDRFEELSEAIDETLTTVRGIDLDGPPAIPAKQIKGVLSPDVLKNDEADVRTVMASLLHQVQEAQTMTDVPSDIQAMARELEKIYLALPTFSRRLIEAYQHVAEAHGLSPGKIRLYMAGGRLKGSPLRYNSDIDLLFEVENRSQAIGQYQTDVFDPEKEGTAEVRRHQDIYAQIRQICEEIDIPDLFEIVAFGGQTVDPLDARPKLLLAESSNGTPSPAGPGVSARREKTSKGMTLGPMLQMLWILSLAVWLASLFISKSPVTAHLLINISILMVFAVSALLAFLIGRIEEWKSGLETIDPHQGIRPFEAAALAEITRQLGSLKAGAVLPLEMNRDVWELRPGDERLANLNVMAEQGTYRVSFTYGLDTKTLAQVLIIPSPSASPYAGVGSPSDLLFYYRRQRIISVQEILHKVRLASSPELDRFIQETCRIAGVEIVSKGSSAPVLSFPTGPTRRIEGGAGSDEQEAAYQKICALLENVIPDSRKREDLARQIMSRQRTPVDLLHEAKVPAEIVQQILAAHWRYTSSFENEQGPPAGGREVMRLRRAEVQRVSELPGDFVQALNRDLINAIVLLNPTILDGSLKAPYGRVVAALDALNTFQNPQTAPPAWAKLTVALDDLSQAIAGASSPSLKAAKLALQEGYRQLNDREVHAEELLEWYRELLSVDSRLASLPSQRTEDILDFLIAMYRISDALAAQGGLLASPSITSLRGLAFLARTVNAARQALRDQRVGPDKSDYKVASDSELRSTARTAMEEVLAVYELVFEEIGKGHSDAVQENLPIIMAYSLQLTLPVVQLMVQDMENTLSAILMQVHQMTNEDIRSELRKTLEEIQLAIQGLGQWPAHQPLPITTMDQLDWKALARAA